MITIRFEDDDGFTTEWPWPDSTSLLHGAKFAAAMETLHDQARAAAATVDDDTDLDALNGMV